MAFRLSKPGRHWIAVTRSPYLAPKQYGTALTKKGFWNSSIKYLVRQCWRGCQDVPQIPQLRWITGRDSRALVTWFYSPVVTFICWYSSFPQKQVTTGQLLTTGRKTCQSGNPKEKRAFLLCAAYPLRKGALGTWLKKSPQCTVPGLEGIRWKSTNSVSHS